MDEALRWDIWTPGTPWHLQEVLICCAQLAVKVNEYRLAGLAAYQAQRLHLAEIGAEDQWGLPDLPGLEVASRRFNLVRYTPVKSRNLQLRQPRVSDREFLMKMFLDPEFARRYSRPVVGHEASRVHALIKGDQRSPQADTAWAWMIASTSDEPLGLIELNKPDFALGNVDLAMGLHQPRFSTTAMEAFCLGLSMAFHHLGMRRVTGHVYGDNPLSHRLHQHMGSVKEYTLEGYVRDLQTGHPIPLTVYSMTPEEARASPWFPRIRAFLPKSAPDLLLDQLEPVSAGIVVQGPRWAEFPPKKLPAIPEAPPPPDRSFTSLPLPPASLDGRRVKLRFPMPEDESCLLEWINTPGLMKAYPDAFDPGMDMQAMRERLGTAPGQVLLWIVEEKPQGRRIGLVGLEFKNTLPVLFGFTGFVDSASLHQILESWRLVKKTVSASYPDARLYLKIPAASPWLPWLERRREFQHLGVERNQAHSGNAGSGQRVMLGYDSGLRPG